ncbi:cell envelope integrity protein CreD [Breznakiella homolactica]|uniref:Cell envelope integrity protein CreD n=1 Tax=Breznakiella homolactica TaxID=2798577 RepID=A0A7T7XK94_9SPIR|nr:cell envelope integrity protein CreD [Breznakiella homolactica]QQO07959.1 cell envelope integrity protein CreD [Breznakiella homolactica]
MQKKITGGSFFGVKALIIAGLSLALLIPVAMLSSIVRERKMLADSVKNDIIAGAGGELFLAGPYLVVPVYETFENKTERRNVVIFPREYTVHGQAATELRSRGIYSAPVFTGNFFIRAVFDIQEDRISPLYPGRCSVQFDQARLYMEVPDPAVLREMPAVTTGDNRTIALTADFAPLQIAGSALGGTIPLSQGPLEVSMDLETGGGGSIRIMPLGMGNDIRIESDWTTPSFIGDTSPIMREIGEDGFSAHWRQALGTGKWPEYFDIAAGTRGFQYYKGFGVELFDSVGVYHKTERALKYALLFIAVPFIVILLFELFAKQRIHPIQYALVGVADIIFYALLLSLAEQINFLGAYILASGAVIAAVSLYTGAVMKKLSRGLVLVPVLVLLYGYLYSALQSQDYALLIGSVGLFAVVVLVMFITRNVDWYALGGRKPPEPPESLPPAFPGDLDNIQEQDSPEYPA